MFLLRNKFRTANDRTAGARAGPDGRGRNNRMRDSQRAATLGLRVYQNVRRQILSGVLQPGQPMSRRRIALEMSTSLLPAAQALQRLEFEGLLESRPRAGTRVRTPSHEDVTGHFVVREALETQAAVRTAIMASAQELQHLETLAQELDERGTRLDVKQYSALHRKFHRQIAAYSRCGPLCDAVDQCHAFAALWLSQIARPSGDHATHQELLRAIVSRDPIKAAEAVALHLSAGSARAMAALALFPNTPARSRSFRARRRRTSTDSSSRQEA
jgi:GntR family transcriptional regulator, rspAB operon transcriptional repressor